MTTRSLSYTPRSDVPDPPALPSEAEVLGRAGRENFRVASRVLPGHQRDHLLAIYGFARLVDQIGDAYPGDRRAALQLVREQTSRALDDPDAEAVHPLIARAAQVVRAVPADPDPLLDLIAANEQDQDVRAYGTFDELVGYCRLSANPVGRLVLAALGTSTPDHVRWSDAICTGLQLAEHWQDVAEDAAAGRVYLPADDLERFGVDTAALTAAPPAGHQLRALMAFEVARARRFLEAGAPLVGSLHGPAKWAVAGFWAGGQAALDAIADRGFDPLYGAPRPSKWRVAAWSIAVLRRPQPAGEAA